MKNFLIVGGKKERRHNHGATRVTHLSWHMLVPLIVEVETQRPVYISDGHQLLCIEIHIDE